MSKSSIRRSITVLFVFIASVALVGADLIALAQNSNSSTQDEPTRGGMMTTQNGNTSSTGGQRRRRGRRSSRPASTSGEDMSNSNMAGNPAGNDCMPGNTNMAGSMGGGRRRRRGRRRAAASTTGDTSAAMPTGGMQATDSADGGVQTDLAGQSYTGMASYADGGVNGTATLAFDSSNHFTLTPEGGTAMSGRYTAVTTRGYTGVTMMFSGATPPQIVSVRLKKMGNGVSIMSVPGESHQFSFTSSGGGNMAKGRRRPRVKRSKRGGHIKPPMANPEPPSNP